MSLSFPKRSRLTKRSEFLSLMRNGKRLVGRYICIDYRPSSEPKLGITASSKYGNSPERNRFKRIVREAYRQNQHDLPKVLEIHVLPRYRAKTASSQDIKIEMLELLSKL